MSCIKWEQPLFLAVYFARLEFIDDIVLQIRQQGCCEIHQNTMRQTTNTGISKKAFSRDNVYAFEIVEFTCVLFIMMLCGTACFGLYNKGRVIDGLTKEVSDLD